MPLEKHDLIHELPEFKDKIHHLKINNKHFAKLFNEYHETDHEVHRIEAGAESTSDEYLDVRKKHRLNLKDQLFAILQSE